MDLVFSGQHRPGHGTRFSGGDSQFDVDRPARGQQPAEAVVRLAEQAVEQRAGDQLERLGQGAVVGALAKARWRGGGRDHLFYRRGGDLVITKPDGQFVTILKDGSTNSYFGRASRIFP